MRAPYPHVEQAIIVLRPALVVSRDPVGPGDSLIWCAMITNARRRGWPGDIEIPNAIEIGLIIPSKIRTAKLSTIESQAATPIARLDAATLSAVLDLIRSQIGGRG